VHHKIYETTNMQMRMSTTLLKVGREQQTQTLKYVKSDYFFNQYNLASKLLGE
jgi:hypothetical protein